MSKYDDDFFDCDDDEIETHKVKFESVVRETEKAWLLEIPRLAEDQRWFPKSLCDINTAAKTIEAPDWLWGKKGIEF